MTAALPGASRHDRLSFALFLALALHAALILGIGFNAKLEYRAAPELAVTLSLRSDQQPVDSTRIAADNQVGSGEQSDRDRVTTATPPEPAPNPGLITTPPPPLIETAAAQQPDRVVTTAAMAPLRRPDSEPEDRPPDQKPVDGLSPEVQRIAEQMASLQAELQERSEAYARIPRVRRLTTESARQATDAEYLRQWRTRVEDVGNRYYPEASIRDGIYGSLQMLVVIRADGSLEDIQILSSSGFALLDESAVKIVRMAAPYAAFPPELARSTDKLEIIRTWQFRQNRLSSR